ncbi:trypsin-like peptidase domain-containing protein [Azospirillum sp. SYSU D00513]|uniref:S1C family serine protease n=1 Tax=Azospirillum sp. SYSU D00513 TaxID=2812561 RepID=UPI001A96329C|nr:trypsin-like peptidase domain-containing protein [Azospirillum sp. SYSU D00513]
MGKPALLSCCLVPILVLLAPAPARAGDCPATRPDGQAAAVRITISTPAGPAHGTGIVWDARGTIVTNDHVVAAGTVHEVTFASGATGAARIVARASDRDIAVLAVDPASLHGPGTGNVPAPQAAARDLRPGDPVFALGNPFGRGLALAQGVVNGFGREVITGPRTHLYDMLETTTPLNPGNSGGPLFDCSGRVVGINTAVLQQGGGSLGFAIPIDHARAVVAALLQGRAEVVEAVSTPMAPAPTALEAVAPARPELGVQVVPDRVGRLMIRQVVPGSPAERAGTRPGDAITRANGRRVSSLAELRSALRTAERPVMVLRILRNGAALDMPVRLTPAS